MDSFPGGQTSFIPKKPLVVTPSQYQARGVSIVVLVSVIIFVTTAALAGGVFVYKNILKNDIANMQESLARARSAFEPELIEKLQRLDKRMMAAQIILHDHLATSALFDVLSRATLQTVRFTGFQVGIDEKRSVVVNMRGQARDYQSVALQSDQFGKTKGIRNPVFSGLTLDSFGRVQFEVTFNVDPALVSYGSASISPDTSSVDIGTSTFPFNPPTR